ncbi:hypothetical protein R6Q59_006327 [Mikania micrantha]
MDSHIDFLEWLEPDMALKILALVSNELSKQLCLKTFPQLACITHVIEPNHESSGVRDHLAFASLFRALTAFPQTYCIADPVSASSTDNYPEESIMNTLDPRDSIRNQGSYWSSKGSDDPETPETLIYNLTANLCVITEINLHPFQAFFQLDFPIYSSRYARFRLGHPKSWKDLSYDFKEAQECADDKFIWTYTSQLFPVAQENCLQRFKLLEPVVCIGGYLQIELLGRVQKQAADDRYYLWYFEHDHNNIFIHVKDINLKVACFYSVTHVQAIGRQLSPAFSVEFSEPFNSVSLKYDSKEFGLAVSSEYNGSLSTSLLPVHPPRQLAWGNLQDFFHMVQAHNDGVEYAWVDDDDDFEMDGEDELDPVII